MAGIVFRIFIAVLLFSPLAFGTVEPWSLAVMEILCLLAGLFLFIKKLRGKECFLYEIPGIIPLVILSVYVLFQFVPLPPSAVQVISPETYNLYQETVLAGEPQGWVPLSIHRKATLIEFFRIASYAVLYIVTIQLLVNRENLFRTVTVVAVFASMLSLFGILHHFLSNEKIYWIRTLTQGGTPFGPYVNRNHYAGLMEMLFPLVLSLFLFYKPRVRYKSFRDRIAEMFNIKKTNIHVLLGFSALLIATSIFLTLSRSGIVSLSLSMVFFGVMFVMTGKNRKRGIIIIVLFVLILLSVGWFGWEPVIERFEKVSPGGNITDLRLQIWKDSANIIKDFPVTGTGFGSFTCIYPRYRNISGSGIADHAHNDYIELFSNGGVIALLLFIWFFVELIFKSYRVFMKRRELYSIYLYIASLTGLISILIHSMTDFNLHIGANGLYFFFLSGLAVSAAGTRLRNGLNETYLKKTELPMKFLTVLISVLLICSIAFHIGVNMGNLFFASFRDVKLYEKISHGGFDRIKKAVSRAALFDPLEARYQYAAANIEKLLSQNETALRYYMMSVRLNPTNGEYLQRLGLIMSEEKNNELADKLLLAGMKYDRCNPERYGRYASWLFSQARTEEGLKIVRSAISLEPQKTREYITLMVLNRMRDEDILTALPEKVEPHLLFADYLQKTGKEEMAEEEYLKALQHIREEERIKPLFFYTVYNYYNKKGRYNDALSVMRRAAEFFPNDAGIRKTVASLYEKAGLPHKAMEWYRSALVIDPCDENARKRLDELTLKNRGS